MGLNGACDGHVIWSCWFVKITVTPLPVDTRNRRLSLYTHSRYHHAFLHTLSDHGKLPQRVEEGERLVVLDRRAVDTRTQRRDDNLNRLVLRYEVRILQRLEDGRAKITQLLLRIAESRNQRA